MKRWIQLVAVIACVTLYVAPASAEKCAGVTMTDTTTVDGDELVLNGMGIREATVFSVDVYVAGLYLEESSDNGSQVAASDQKKKLVMAFVRDVDKSDITDAYRQSLKKTASGKGLEAKISKLLGWMEGMSTGETQKYTYIPGEGLTVELKGNEKGTIEGADFGEAFFNIWLGSNPPNAGLKRGMLGGKCG
jgi:hypothetical protein